MKPKEDKKITSLQNSRIKKVVELRERKNRDESGLMIVEGFRELLRAQEENVVFKELYVCEEFFHHRGEEDLIKILEKKDIEIFDTTSEVFEKISFGDRQEGLLAVCQKPHLMLEDLRLKDKPLLVVVERVEKPGNLGAILRVCDGVAVDGLIVCDGQTDSYNPNVIRASIGTVFSVKVIESPKEQALNFLYQHGIKVCVTSPKAPNLYTQPNLNVPLAIIVGSEEEGLSDFWFQNADLQIKIPMEGKADSLNVSVSTAIVIYEAIRQRNS